MTSLTVTLTETELDTIKPASNIVKDSKLNEEVSQQTQQIGERRNRPQQRCKFQNRLGPQDDNIFGGQQSVLRLNV